MEKITLLQANTALTERNRLLVLENDELNAQLIELKLGLQDISTHIGDITNRNMQYDAYIEVKRMAHKLLEETK